MERRKFITLGAAAGIAAASLPGIARAEMPAID